MNNPIFKIDEDVAEHVMGFAAWPCCVHGELPANCIYQECKFGNSPRFKPTINLMHAFMVANHMIENRGYDFDMRAYNKNMGEEIVYYVQFEIPDQKIQSFADELSPTLAICNAALKAVTNE